MIRLIFADDHPIVREGLKRLVEDLPDMAVVGEAETGDEVLEEVRSADADVLVLDVTMPGPGVLELIRRLLEEHPRLRILVLSVHPEEQYAVRTLRAGAAGYLMKNNSPEELALAIRRVHAGNRYVSPTLAEALLLGLEREADASAHESLSNREFQVLCLLGSGSSLKEIAARLEVSPKTVGTYRARLLEKLGVRTTADLIRYAIEHDLKP